MTERCYIVHAGSQTVLAADECHYVYHDGEYDEEAILASKDRAQTVWVLHISHRHGDEITLHATYDSAWKELVEFAGNYWDDDAAVNRLENEPKPLPEKDQEIVDGYFDGNEYEFYEIEKRLVRA